MCSCSHILNFKWAHLFLFLGELKTLAPLDREDQATYNLLVKATDGGGRFCQADIVLTLEDVNDNAPEFSADPYTITVFENTEPGTLLTRVQATDVDAGIAQMMLLPSNYALWPEEPILKHYSTFSPFNVP